MQALQGDAGTRDLLLEYAANVSSVEVSDEAILLDIDTQGALAEISNLNPRPHHDCIDR